MTASGILHAKPVKSFVSGEITSEVVCGPLTTQLSLPVLTNNYFQNQQYLPDATDTGFVAPQFLSSSGTECPVHTYQVLSGPPATTCAYTTYELRKTSHATALAQ